MVTAAGTKPCVRQDSLVQGIRKGWKRAVCSALGHMAAGATLADADSNNLHMLSVGIS